jgi:hypothetical protein
MCCCPFGASATRVQLGYGSRSFRIDLNITTLCGCQSSCVDARCSPNAPWRWCELPSYRRDWRRVHHRRRSRHTQQIRNWAAGVRDRWPERGRVSARGGLRMTAFHPTCYQLVDKELSRLLEIVLAGEVVGDRAIAERIVRFLGAVISLHERHIVTGGAEGAWRGVDGVGRGADRTRARCIRRSCSVSPSHSNSCCPQSWTHRRSTRRKIADRRVAEIRRVVMNREDEAVGHRSAESPVS